MRVKRSASGSVRASRWAQTTAILFTGIALAAAGTGTAAAQDAGLGLPPGTPAPDARVQDLDGNAVSLLDVVGSGPALIKFWASWCEQCEALQPQIDEIQARFSDRITVVAVAVAVNQSPRRIRRHVDRHAPGYAFVYDAAGEAVRAYRALTTAIVVLVDGDGRIASTGVGPGQDLVGSVASMLGAEPTRR